VAPDEIVFWVFAPISIGSAIAMLLQRNAVHAALFLVVNFFTIAVFYLVLGASFLFAVQIIVYAGAIMVLFLFVIMLLGVDRKESLIERLPAQRPLTVLFALLVAAEIFFAVRLGVGFSGTGSPSFAANGGGSTQALAKVLFKNYFFPFEVTSVLLIIAAIGAVMHGRRRITEEDTIDMPADEGPDGDGRPLGDGQADSPVGAVAGNGAGADRTPAETGGGA